MGTHNRMSKEKLDRLKRESGAINYY